MSRTEKILRIIKNKKVNIKELCRIVSVPSPDDTEALIYMLAHEGYIYQDFFKQENIDKPLKITAKGLDYLSESSVNKTLYWIPIIIDAVLSIIALVISAISLYLQLR